MIEIRKFAAQGDVLLRKICKLPDDVREQPRNGPLVIAHSETGHHHTIDSPAIRHFEIANSPLVHYLQMTAGCETGIDVVHHRPWDTHETLRLLGQPGDVWEVRRQREWTPEGWRRVED
jgi:hypothetical protein